MLPLVRLSAEEEKNVGQSAKSRDAFRISAPITSMPQ
jgi:hypothetical protein